MSTAMEAFLEAQTRFLQQQQQFATDEEARKKEIHLAQLHELEERSKLLKLEEEKSAETAALREDREKKKQKMKQADRLEKWHDGDQADAYLAKFETVMTECEVPKEQWRGRLVNCLTGKALSAYRSVAQVGVGDNDGYDSTKEKLLEAMGFGIEQTRRKFWNTRRTDTSPMDMLRQLDSFYSCITRDCSTLADLRQEILIGRLLSLYPSDIADYVYIRNPTNAHQAAHYLQNYLDSRPWRKSSPRHKEVSGFGKGMGHGGGGDPGNSSREHSRKHGGKEHGPDTERRSGPIKRMPLRSYLSVLGVG